VVKTWASEDNLLHSNGLLYPSGALREFIFSIFLGEQASQLINPVSNFFLMEGTPYSKQVAEKLYAQFDTVPGHLDHAFTSQTVKSGDFIRFSNIRYIYNLMGTRFDAPGDAIALAELLAAIKHGLHRKPHDAEVIIEPSDLNEIIEGIYAAAIQSIKNVIAINMLGVKLGSLGNNFSLDGRFIDLEVPVFTGESMLTTHMAHDQFSISEIFECLGAYFQFSYYLKDFKTWASRSFNDSTHGQCKEILSELTQAFSACDKKYQWLNDPKQVAAFITDGYMAHGMQLTKKAQLIIEMAIRNPLMQVSGSGLGAKEEAPIDLAMYQVGYMPKCHVLTDLAEKSDSVGTWDKAKATNEALNQSEQCTSPDALFQICNDLKDSLV